MGLVTLTFDLLTLKLVCESHLRWGTFLPNMRRYRRLDSRIIRYVRDDGPTDRRTDGQKHTYCPFPGHNKMFEIKKILYL